MRWWQDRHRTDLERALAYAPPDTARYSWTDWAGVRRELGADLDAGSSAEDVEQFLSDGFDADLTSGSAMVESATVLQQAFGFSPADVDWELLAQSDTGSVLIVGLPDGLDVDELGDGFEALGYERPEEDDGVWNGGEELVARISESNGSSLSPQFQYLALDADRHLLLASDNGPYLRQAVGERRRRPRRRRARATSPAAVGEPLSAAVYTGDFACKSLAMAQADEDDQSTADQLVAAAGGVDPMTGFAMAVEPDRQVTRGDGVRDRRPGPPQRRQPREARRRTRRPARAATSASGSRSARSPPTGRWCTMRAEAGRRQPGAVRPLDRPGAVRDLLRTAGT